jgi:hypothetical protein
MTPTTSWRRLAGVVLCWAASVAIAAAQPTLYTNKATWTGVAGPVNVITFEGLAPAAGYAPYDTSSGLPLSGVRFIGVSPASVQKNYLRVVDAQYLTGFDFGSGAFLHGPPEVVGPAGEGGAGSGITAALPGGITALGMDVMSFVQYGSVIAVTVTTSNSAQQTFNVTAPAYPQRGFVGFVSALPILAVRVVGKTGFPSLDNFSFGGPTAIGSPTLVASVAGSTAAFSWTAAPVSAPISHWRLEASFSSFGTAFTTFDTALPSLVAPNVPNGTYFVRVRGMSGTTGGPSSNEVRVVIGPCATAPLAPTGLTGSAANGVIALGWTPPATGCVPTGYLIRAGTGPGLADIGVVPVGAVTSLSAPVPARTYYVAVLAQNAAGLSPPSNEVAVVVTSACTIPAAPANFTATSALDVVTLSWQPPPGAVTRYRLEIGSVSGGTDLGVAPIVAPGLQAAGVQRGTYYLRVRAENACGIGPATAERVLTVSW